jgi:DNA-binding winged helix-turn-helix (wHTH) protein
MIVQIPSSRLFREARACIRARSGSRRRVEGGHPVHLGSRALDILVALVERAGHVVEKHELVARVWPDNSVEENNLKVHVVALRRTLAQEALIPK